MTSNSLCYNELRLHEWLTDTLAATATAGANEGDDWAFNTATTRPTRISNVTQIFRKDIAASETQRAVNPAGFKDARVSWASIKSAMCGKLRGILGYETKWVRKNPSVADNPQERPEMESSTTSTRTISKKLTIRDRAYGAGILDSEGYIMAYRCGKKEWKRDYASLRVGIANTDTRLMDWLVETFGGNYRPKSKNKLSKKPCYEWRPSNPRWFLGVVRQFMKVKQQHADCAIAFYELPKAPHKRWSLANKIRVLNGSEPIRDYDTV